jgi:hypothetical protein
MVNTIKDQSNPSGNPHGHQSGYAGEHIGAEEDAPYEAGINAMAQVKPQREHALHD